MLKRYADVKPDPAKADLYHGYVAGRGIRSSAEGMEMATDPLSSTTRS